ncbi:MAG TPA: S9 family peptidase [Candidatus Polarisedimenticolia bacterium]|nr:S9 family peptidase [Candidatus Polarisedimenticolia bacterium]
MRTDRLSAAALTAALVLCPGLHGAAPVRAAEARTPLTPELLWRIQRLGAPSISPDGSWVAVPVTAYDLKEDKGKTDLWVVPTRGGEPRRLTTHDASDSNPSWSPDGRWILFESKREGDDETQIYVISTEGGEARRVTKVPTGASAAKWFPDSKRIAFMSWVWEDLASWEDQARRLKERKESKISAKVWDKPIIRWWDHWVEDRDPHLYSIPIDGGETTAITLASKRCLPREEPGRGSYDLSPDGAEVAFASDVDTSGVDQNYDIFTVSASGGEARNVSPDNPADDDAPLYSPDGRWLAFGRQTIKGFYADRVRLVLLDRRTGERRAATEAWDRSVAGLVWSPRGDALYGAIDDAGTQRVHRIEVPSGRPMPITRERSFSSLALARDGRTMAALRQSFIEPPTLVMVNLGSGAATKISDFNDELLAEVDFGDYQSVTFKGARGEPVQMWINYPPRFDRSRRWPTFLLLHGGPHNGVTDAWQPRWNAQLFSAWGYVTAWHNFHGSSGFGQDFTDSINPLQSELPYEDSVQAARYLSSQPWADPGRMVAGGGSFGGYLAAILLGREHPFKALVAHAAVYNWYTQYGADYGAGKRRFGEHWEKPDIWRRSSPHFGAGSFDTPTLVIHGQLDYRVPLNHGIELFQTLQNRGVRSRLVYYPDENHWILKPNNSIFWYGQVGDWIREFAPPGPRP